METKLKFENRSQLYDFLINEFGFRVIEEKYDAQSFGNYFINLSSPQFLLQYINDRGFLTVYIAAHADPQSWFALTFVKNYLHKKQPINSSEEGISNETRINELNDFLKNDFSKIGVLFGDKNYFDFKKQLENILREEFLRKFR